MRRLVTGKILMVALVSGLLPAVSAVGQQDPLDQGEADSAFVILRQPRLGIDDSIAVAKLYFFNDAQTVVGASIGLSWDNPLLQIDSAVFSAEAEAAFSLFRYTLYKGDVDSSNANRLFQCSCLGHPDDGLAPGSQPRLIATYYFSLEGWAVGESFCVDAAPFVAASFVAPGVGEYGILWRGLTCVEAGSDGDGDGVGDDWDNCPSVANSDQADFDSDEIGDLCDLCTDRDDDGFGDPGFPVNTCPADNCPGTFNPLQEDADGDGIGDACETDCCQGRVGDVNGLGGDEPTIGDIAVIIDLLFVSADPALVSCVAEADVNQSGGAVPVHDDITIGDITYLIDYLFITGRSLGLPDCP